MAADMGTFLLAAVGVGVIVTGVILIMTLKQQQETKKEVVIQNEPIGWGWAGGWLPNWGPYYSHMPVRPLIY